MSKIRIGVFHPTLEVCENFRFLFAGSKEFDLRFSSNQFNEFCENEKLNECFMVILGFTEPTQLSHIRACTKKIIVAHPAMRIALNGELLTIHQLQYFQGTPIRSIISIKSDNSKRILDTLWRIGKHQFDFTLIEEKLTCSEAMLRDNLIGFSEFTNEESQTLALLSSGLTQGLICEKLHVNRSTIHRRIKSMCAKTATANLRELLITSSRKGWVSGK